MNADLLRNGDMLRGLLDDPEMLKKAVDIAGTLAKSGVLSGLAPDLGKTAEPSPQPPPQMPPQMPEHPKKTVSESDKHKKLLEALALYVAPEKRARIELVIKLLNLLELAGSMGITLF